MSFSIIRVSVHPNVTNSSFRILKLVRIVLSISKIMPLPVWWWLSESLYVHLNITLYDSLLEFFYQFKTWWWWFRIQLGTMNKATQPIIMTKKSEFNMFVTFLHINCIFCKYWKYASKLNCIFYKYWRYASNLNSIFCK